MSGRKRTCGCVLCKEFEQELADCRKTTAEECADFVEGILCTPETRLIGRSLAAEIRKRFGEGE